METGKKNEYVRINVITTLCCLVPMVVGALFYSKLPAKLPVHFGVSGSADRYASKEIPLFVIPLGLLALQILVCFISSKSKEKKGMSYKLQVLERVLIPVIATFIQIITITSGLHSGNDMNRLITVSVGVLFLVIGNFLPKCKQNAHLGIKIYTTLRSEENWNKTHRMAGFVWVIGGLLIMGSSYFDNLVVACAIIISVVVLPIVYSLAYGVKTK